MAKTEATEEPPLQGLFKPRLTSRWLLGEFTLQLNCPCRRPWRDHLKPQTT